MEGPFSETFERELARVRQLARTRGHRYVTLEHIVLAILDEPTAGELFRQYKVPRPAFRRELLTYIEMHTPQRTDDQQEIENLHSVISIQARACDVFDSPSGIHLLEMMFEERFTHSYAVQLLRKHGIRREQVVAFRERAERAHSTHDREGSPRSRTSGSASRAHAESSLRRCTVNLNRKARAGKIDPLVGREMEMQRIVQTLGRRRKNNVVLVGEAGVGKTALAEGLAARIVQKKAPKALAQTTILSLNVGNLVAGTRFRGDFEQRMKHLLAGLRQQADAILFIDEIHMLIGAGSVTGMAMDAGDFFKPLLAAGELRCIGTTTHREFRQVFERDAALARRFQRIDIEAPSREESYAILQGLCTRYEEHHQVTYSDEVLQAAVDLSDKYVHDRQLPDKAIDLLDEVGSQCRLEHAGEGTVEVTLKNLERTLAMVAHLPQDNVHTSTSNLLLDLGDWLGQVIYGQDEAIKQLAQTMRIVGAKLKPEQRPMGSFLFSGPTGVGKTEVCRQLAKIMGVELIRFDMSEYIERHAVARLVGAPPGYVGYYEGGLLTEAVMKNPYAVLLLDEVEKAHPDILNVLLQVMDYGKLTDSNGRTVDFRNLVLVMTCNAGAEEAARQSIGFTRQDHSLDIKRILEQTFRPEFRNRLDAIVQFSALSMDSILAVVDRQLEELQESLRDRDITLKVDAVAREWLAKQGFDPQMGARPLERVVREHLRVPLADAVLRGTFEQGGAACFTVTQGQLEMCCLCKSAADESVTLH